MLVLMIATVLFFSTIIGEPRTDVAYKNMQESNQISVSPFASIQGFGLRSCCPPDYQHLVCLGVVRKLISYYFTQTKHLRLRCRAKPSDIKAISDRVEEVAGYWPNEFQRKPRRIDQCLAYFKATEYRYFLVYLFFLLKDCLPDDYYKHFLLLHCATYIFLSDNHRHMHDFAKGFVEKFVRDMSQLSGHQSVTYNVHCLLHLHEFYLSIGNLNQFSTFPFENFLNVLKHRIKKTRGIFAQTANQLEMLKLICDDFDDRFLHYSIHSPNNCCLLETGDWILCDEFDGSRGGGYKLSFSRVLYEKPISSRIFGIGRYIRSRQYVTGKVINKGLCVPSAKEFIVIPFIRSNGNNSH